ncbi:probable WRKY transcription factor 32 isoform X2 [Ricinus communis]|uniref:probable WRKY transcription factor 32 isoform X2 n=1 Tax=Ricinus communis TaxID=3988 RepID=UPI00201AAD5F|nr:probable WRKY transcription factor 32 isoform X2 [Ricinus communis]
MAESKSVEALQVQHKRQVDEHNDHVLEEQEEDDDDEEEDSQLSELDQLGESQQPEELSSGPVELEALVAVPTSTAILENKQCVGLEDNAGLEKHVDDSEFKEQDGISHPEVSGDVTSQCAEAQTQNQLQSSVCPTSLSELSPTSVTQPISSAPSPTLPEPRVSPSKFNNYNACIPEADQQNSSELKSLSLPIVKAHVLDGYNWRKYGQKQVKSPKGSRSYYKCTYSDCCAKKIECADHSGHVIEIVNKGTHSHDPPRKNNSTRGSKVALLSAPVLENSMKEHSMGMHTDSSQSTLFKDSIQETPNISEKKRQNSSGSDGNGKILIKEEHVSEPEPKRRMKKENLECSGTLLKPGKKPKFVVHAAGDVGISSDGYRWRKYGQKMVKGNPHPRNYYRCTSAGCPVRKHIETAVDNTDAVIITYKGVHDHDMPVPKKRHGPPSAPLVAAAAPASMSNLQLKKTDTLPNQISSTQWSVGKEGELTSETLDLGGEKEKAIESARTLLSIGFEIKPC